MPIAGFSAIVADPPWPYDDPGVRGGIGHHYKPMDLMDIARMPVARFAATNSHLYLCTTNAFVRQAFVVMEAWSFRYITTITWVKPRIGNGYYFRNTTEHILFGVRGKAPLLRKNLPTHFEAPVGEHSRKPDRLFEIVEAASPAAWLEVFARGPSRRGWVSWGDQAQGRVLPLSALQPMRPL